MKTKAAILVEQKQPLVIDEVEIPSLSYGQVLVEVKVSRICGSQVGEIEGVKGPDRYLPHLLGHEGGAVVLEVGPEVTRVKAGDRVVLHWREAAGIACKPAKYVWNGKTINAGHITTFQQYTVVSENRLTVISDKVSYDTAALMADTITTGFGTINNNAEVKIGESVLIIGCGGIGLGAVLGAKLAGACPVIAADIQDHKLKKALEVGATHAINTKEQSLADGLKSILGSQQPDVIIDGTGQPAVLEQAYQLVSPKGRCVIIGVMPHDKKLSINTLSLHFGKTFTGSHGGSSKPDIEIPRYLRMMDQGLFRLDNFISHRFTLDKVNEGIQGMKSGEVIHAVIDF